MSKHFVFSQLLKSLNAKTLRNQSAIELPDHFAISQILNSPKLVDQSAIEVTQCQNTS